MKYAICILDIANFTDMLYENPYDIIDKIYLLRQLCKYIAKPIMTNYAGDSVNILLPDINSAILYANQIMKLYPLPLHCTIGYGTFIFTNDDMFSTEFNEAAHLNYKVKPGKIYLTDKAKQEYNKLSKS